MSARMAGRCCQQKIQQICVPQPGHVLIRQAAHKMGRRSRNAVTTPVQRLRRFHSLPTISSPDDLDAHLARAAHRAACPPQRSLRLHRATVRGRGGAAAMRFTMVRRKMPLPALSAGAMLRVVLRTAPKYAARHNRRSRQRAVARYCCAASRAGRATRCKMPARKQ